MSFSPIGEAQTTTPSTVPSSNILSGESTPSPLADRFRRLKEAVLSRRPILNEIIQKEGQKTLYDYAREYSDVNFNPRIEKRKAEFIETFRQEVAVRLGPGVAQSAARQLQDYYYVSTADHHGPLTSPFFVNSNLVAAAPFFEEHDPLLNNVIVLACANVSINNSSFPRGLLFHTYHHNTVEQHRLSFLPSTARLCPVYNFRPYGTDEIQKVKKHLHQKVQEGTVNDQHREHIHELLDEVYLHPEILACQSYSDQITKTNFGLWKKFFAKSHATSPNLIYLEQESLVARLIINHHLTDETTIHQILFTNDCDEHIKQFFNGVMGAFHLEEKWGTYLFWALPVGQKYRIQLWKQGNRLVSDDGSFAVELTPEAIREALENKTIIPGMMLIYCVLAMYYGLKCLGGFSQVNYLTYMKNAYIKMQADRHKYKSIELCVRVQTKELGGDFSIAFLGTPNNTLVSATGLDLLLYGKERTWPSLMETSRRLTVEQALNPMMPEFYRIIYTEAQRTPELNNVTQEEISHLTGLDQIIQPCAMIQ